MEPWLFDFWQAIKQKSLTRNTTNKKHGQAPRLFLLLK